jgi:hypothetical protein
MLKFIFTLIITILNSIKLISTDCPDDYLYCYNIKKELLGKILVNYCWTWLRFSCQPCRASTDQLFITYDKYIHHCRYYYQATNEIQAWDSTYLANNFWRIRFRG